MIRKIWTIASKDIIASYTDRNLILIMLITPLAISSIIALAFSGIGGGGGIEDITVALVNLDAGDDEGQFNGGQIFVDALIRPADASQEEIDANPLFTLTDTTLLTDPDEARAGVEDGTYTAAVIIPEDFSESIDYSATDTTFEPVEIEVYGDSGRAIRASIVRSVIASIANQITTGQIAIAATVETQGAGLFTGSAQPDFSLAYADGLSAVGVEQQSPEGDSQPLALLVIFGSAQAAFFALFTANGGAANVLEERRNGTLQRLLISPTPRWAVLLAKLIAVLAIVVLQLVLLFLAFNLVNGLLEGEFRSIWGTDWLAIAALVLATALAVSGVGMIPAAVAKTSEQAQLMGGIIALLMGTVGGAFFQLPDGAITNLVGAISVVRWGSEGFTTLAEGSGSVLPHITVLVAIGAILFALSLVLFNRRQDI